MLAAIPVTMPAAMPLVVADNGPWRVLRVMTGREALVDFQLRRASIEATVLKTTVVRTPHGAGRPETVERPLFPGYVLLRCDDEDRGHILRTFPFLIDFLRFGPQPAMVRQDEIDRVNMVTSSGVDYLIRHHLRRGTKVRVKYGPLAGLVGNFLGEKGGIIVVSVEMFARGVATRMAWDQVEPLEPNTSAL